MTDRAPVVVVSADAPVFSGRTLAWFAGLGATSFAVALVVLALGPELATPPSYGADTFSRSAIGHGALVELLRDLERPVVVSRYDTPERTRAPGVLVVAEPTPVGSAEARSRAGRADLVELLAEADGAVLVVLAKRTARPSDEEEGWAGRVDFIPPAEVARTLHSLGLPHASVRRPERAPRVTRSIGVEGGAARTPELGPDAQLIVDPEDRIAPLVETPEGIVLGRFEATLEGDDLSADLVTREVHVLADPDLIANHGLGRGENAAFIVELLDQLREGTGPIVLDETHHGHVARPSIWGELLRFPLVALTLHGLLAAGLAALAGAARFGAPLPPKPAHEPGKGQLIDHTAALLAYGGHGGFALRRYLDAATREVGRALRAPADLDPDDLYRWLDRAARERGSPLRLGPLRERARELGRATARAADQDLVRAAREVHAWKEGMLHGPTRGS